MLITARVPSPTSAAMTLVAQIPIPSRCEEVLEGLHEARHQAELASGTTNEMASVAENREQRGSAAVDAAHRAGVVAPDVLSLLGGVARPSQRLRSRAARPAKKTRLPMLEKLGNSFDAWKGIAFGRPLTSQ